MNDLEPGYPTKPNYQIIVGHHETAGIYCRIHGKLADLPEEEEESRAQGYIIGYRTEDFGKKLKRIRLTQVFIQMHERSQHPRRYAKNQIGEEDAVERTMSSLTQTGAMTKEEVIELWGLSPRKEEN